MTEETGIETAELETTTDADVENGFEEIAAKAETAEETARAVWKELQEKADAEAESEPKDAPEEDKSNDVSEAARKLASARKAKKRQTFVPADEQSSAETDNGTQPKPADGKTEKYEPPASWEVKDKEWFHAQPPEIQKNAISWFKNAQAHTTKLWQDLNREAAATKEVREVTQSYRKELDLPDHLTDGQIMKQYFEYQKHINRDSVGAIAEMMRHRGVSISDLHSRITGQTQAPAHQQQQAIQQTNYLTPEEIRRMMREEAQQLEQSRAQEHAVRSATAEVEGLQREMQNGRYSWPELHDPAYIQRIQPLVSYYRETTPSWAETYKKAVLQDRANRGVGSPSPAVPRLTSENIQSAKLASSSLRSRGGNGAIPRMADPKPNESAHESATAVWHEIFGNKQH